MSRFRLLLLVAAALLLSFAGQAARGAPAAPPAVRIESVTYTGQNPFGPGERLTVTMRATGGGAATFHLFGVTTDIGMREVRAAGYPALTTVYTGTYVVRPGDGVRNAGLFASLSARGVEVMAAGARMVTIDARPPQITGRYPAPGANIANARPNIAVTFFDAETGINPASVRLMVNGQNVTGRAFISDTAVTYNPDAPLAPGTVRVDLAAADRARNILRVSWTFRVTRPAGALSAVTINPVAALTNDDVLTVVAAGAPGGAASFSIAGIRGEWPMKESTTKGIYFGTMVVRQAGPLFNAVVEAALRKDGRRSTLAASVPVTIIPGPPSPPTIAAADRTITLNDPEARLTLSGSARPGHRILGRLDYESRGEGFEGGGTLGEFLVVAGADGTWRTTLSRLAPLPGGRLTVTVIAIDQADRRSAPAMLELTSS